VLTAGVVQRGRREGGDRKKRGGDAEHGLATEELAFFEKVGGDTLSLARGLQGLFLTGLI
jgi:hypothetical protein